MVSGALEEQHPVGKNICCRHVLAEAFRHGAEVLAHHQAALTMAFKRQDSEEVVRGIAHISAGARLLALRHPVEMLQPIT